MSNEEITFTVTNKAKIYISSILQDENADAAFVVRVDGGGCGGFQFNMYIDNSYNKDSPEWRIIHRNPRIICDEFTYPLLQGWTLDTGDDYIGPRLQMINKGDFSSCGCGLSFSPK